MLPLTGCFGGSGVGFAHVPVTDFFLAGLAIDSFTGAGAADADAQALARYAAEYRGYYMGLYHNGGEFDSENHLIADSELDSIKFNGETAIGDTAVEDTLAEGTIKVNQATDTATITLPIPTSESDFAAYTNVRLTGTFDLSEGQALIEDVRDPVFDDNVSTATIPAEWMLIADHPAGAVEIEFSQPLRGYSDLYFAPR